MLNSDNDVNLPLLISSSKAPPPVDINEILHSLLFFFIADTESPPPTKENEPFFVDDKLKLFIYKCLSYFDGEENEEDEALSNFFLTSKSNNDARENALFFRCLLQI